MIEKSDYIRIFNAMARETPVSFQTDLLPLVSDYLTEINYKNSDKIIYLITQKPQLMQYVMPVIENYFCKKYHIFYITVGSNLLKKTIYYYE